MLLSSPSVQIGLTDFAEDIAEPILPILEALGLLDPTGQHLDLDGWNFSKAMDFAKSYERTSAILTILDMLDSTIQSFPMYRSTDGHVTAEFSLNSIEETWYKIMETPIGSDGTVVETCITLHRTELDEQLADGHHCQSLVVGAGLRVLNFRIGQTNVRLNLAISLPLFGSISSATDISTMVMLKKEDAGALDSLDAQQLCSVSIQASFSPHEGEFLLVNEQVGSAKCKSIDIACAISPVGSDVDLTLVEFSGSMNTTPVDVGIDLVTPSGGFMPDWNQLFQTFSSSIGNELLRQHLFPALGLLEASVEGLELPTLPVLDIMMNLGSPQYALNSIRDWIFEIVTDSENLYRWLGHIRQFFIGTVTNVYFSGFDRYQLDMTRDSPWRIEWMSTTNFTLYLDLWNDTSSDGIPCFNFGMFCELTKPINSVELDLGLRFHLIRLKSEGSNLFDFAPEISLEFSINPIVSEFLFNVDASNLFQPAIDGLNGQCSVGAFLMGLDFIKGTGLHPYCLLVDLNLGNQSFPEFDLLNDSLAEAALEEALIQLRSIISQTFSTDPILQRLGAILGLCSPRGGTFQSNVWEGGALDLRVGGTNQGGNLVSMPTLLQYITEPLQSIGRYHRELFRISSVPGTEGSAISNTHAWSFIAEAVQDILHSFFQLSKGESILPIREWEEIAAGISYETDGTLHHHTLQFTPIDSVVPLNLEFEFEEESDQLSILPFFGFEHVNIGGRLEMDVGIYFILFSCFLPPQQLTDASWATRANLEASMKRKMVENEHPPMNLISYSSVSLTLQEVTLGFEWVRFPSISYGYYVTIDDLQCSGQMPDLKQFFIQLPQLVGPEFDFSLLRGLSWDGISLTLPDGSFIIFSGIDLGWHHRPDGNGGWLPKLSFDAIPWPLDLGSHLNLPSLPSISLSSGSLASLFSVPQLTIRSIDFDGLSFDLSSLFQQLFPSMSGQFSNWNLGDFLKLPQIKILLGQFLTIRGGRLGFFLGGFFNLDSTFPHMDLRQFLTRGDFTLPNVSLPDWPERWKIFHGMSEHSFGLGPFSLPFDWPELDFDLFVDNPFESLRIFLRHIFSASSKSGEPFAFPALRWIFGLFSGSLPDLRLPDIGWGKNRQQPQRERSWLNFDFEFDFEFELDFDRDTQHRPNNPFGLALPKIPWTVDGTGTYEDPWAVGIQPKGWPKFELLFWLDPDGLPRQHVEEILSHLNGEILAIVNSMYQSTFTPHQHPQLPIGWEHSLAFMIHYLQQFDRRAKHAIGHMSVAQIRKSLRGLELYLRNSDGLIHEINQLEPMNEWANRQQSLSPVSHHFDTIQDVSVIQECTSFLNLLQDTHDDLSVLLIVPYWLDPSNCQTIATALYQTLNVNVTTSPLFDFSAWPQLSETTILSHANQLAQPQRVNVLKPSFSIQNSEKYDLLLAQQVKLMVEHISQSNGGKVFIIGHSIGGLAAKYYTQQDENGTYLTDTEGEDTVEERVAGVVTISSPLDAQPVRDAPNGDDMYLFLHLLRLLGAIPVGPPSTHSIPGVQSGPNDTVIQNKAFVEQLGNLMFSDEIMKKMQRSEEND